MSSTKVEPVRTQGQAAPSPAASDTANPQAQLINYLGTPAEVCRYIGDLLDKSRDEALPALQQRLLRALADKQEVAFSGGATIMKIIGG